MKFNKARKTLAAAMVAGTLAVTTLPLQEVVAKSSPPSEQVNFYAKKQGKLIARGVAVRVKITVDCEPGTNFYNAMFKLAQRTPDGKVNRSYRYFNPSRIPCVGERVNIPVLIEAEQYAYNKGYALLTTELSACDRYNCETYTENRTIWLKK